MADSPSALACLDVAATSKPGEHGERLRKAQAKAEAGET